MLAERLYFQTPSPIDNALPYTVVAGGQRSAPRGVAPITTRFHEHSFIFTLEGEGLIEVRGRAHHAPPGSVTWIDTATPYAHSCAPRAISWDYIWIGIRRDLSSGELFSVLDAHARPVFPGRPDDPVRQHFECVINLMRAPAATGPATISAAVAALLAILVERRVAVDGLPGAFSGFGRIGDAVAAIRADIVRPWTVDEMARLSSISPSQFHRVFKQRPGYSPIDWLRHERINQARRYLGDRSLTVGQVGRLCGYADPYHFSRDFKRVTGASPTLFRRNSEFPDPWRSDREN